MHEFLSMTEVADLLGYTNNTVKSYYRKGMLPAPDARIGGMFGWEQETILNWQKGRPRPRR